MPVEKPSTAWVYNFLKRFGWSLLSSSSEQASLGYNHPDMKLYRQHVENMIAEGVHQHLILNFDQVWRCAFQWNGKMHWKARDLVGKPSSKTKAPKKLDKKRHAVRGARESLTDDENEWKALPYEACGAVVRSLMLHLHKVNEARAAKDKLLAEDPQSKKAATVKAVAKAMSMQHVERYLVYNPRTGQLATEAWLSHHIQVVDGKPQWKNPTKKHHPPKVLTLEVKILDDAQVDLKLDLGDSVPRPVRCFDLRTTASNGDLEFLTQGFGHMGHQNLDDEDGNQEEVDFDEIDFPDENEFDGADELLDDSAGLAGQREEDEWCPMPDEQLGTADGMEDSMMKVVDTGVPIKKPVSFHQRQAYKELEEKGLVDLPPVAGVFLSCHPSSCQWHSAYPQASGELTNRAPKWSFGIRTERQAILICLKFLWEFYFKKTGLGEEHLAKLKAADS
eukprot:Skav213420  [mRNA]  locus=scaffold38:167382:172740:- [translate_table: standard]